MTITTDPSPYRLPGLTTALGTVSRCILIVEILTSGKHIVSARRFTTEPSYCLCAPTEGYVLGCGDELGGIFLRQCFDPPYKGHLAELPGVCTIVGVYPRSHSKTHAKTKQLGDASVH